MVVLQKGAAAVTTGLHINLYLLVIIASLGGFLFGYDTGIVSDAVVLLSSQYDLSLLQQQLIVSLAVCGSLVGSMLSGFVADRFGRKSTSFASCLLFIIGAFIMCFLSSSSSSKSTILITLYIGRFIVGLGIGIASMILPLYVAEVSPTSSRGTLVTSINLAVTGGQVISAIVGAVFYSFVHSNTESWRWMFGLSIIPAMLQLLGFFFLPESPRWMLEKGKFESAVRSLQKLRGVPDVRDEIFEILNSLKQQREEEDLAYVLLNTSDDGNFPPRQGGEGRTYSYDFINSLVTTKISRSSSSMDQYQSNVNNSTNFNNDNTNNKSENKSASENILDRTTTSVTQEPAVNTVSRPPTNHYYKLLTNKTTQRALLVGCALQAAQQFGGINTVMYYTTTILIFSGFSDSSAMWLAVPVAMCNFLGCLAATRAVDVLGRRQLTLGSLALVVLSLLLISLCFFIAEGSSVHASSSNIFSNGDECSQYRTCFDCLYDISCGFCTNVTATSGGSSCLKVSTSDPRQPAEPSLCSISDFSSSICPNNGAAAAWLLFSSMCVYLLCFAPGMGALPWTINSELYPTAIRGGAISIATSVNWASNFIMSSTFLTVIKSLGRSGAFQLYAVISTGFLFFLFIYLPETKDVPLEGVRLLFSDRQWRRRGKCPRAFMRFCPAFLSSSFSHNYEPDQSPDGDIVYNNGVHNTMHTSGDSGGLKMDNNAEEGLLENGSILNNNSTINNNNVNNDMIEIEAVSDDKYVRESLSYL